VNANNRRVAVARSKWNAASNIETPLMDPKDVTTADVMKELADGAALNAARVRYFNCIEPEQSAQQMILRLTAYADQACACDQQDAACWQSVEAAQDQYLNDTWHGSKGTGSEKEQIAREMRRFENCLHGRPTTDN
jgi:transcriptional regulator of acetoin/glycerol metabolism